MSKVLDIWVNLLPIIFILNIYSIIKLALVEKEFWGRLYDITLDIFFTSTFALGSGRGNSFIAMTMIIIMIVYYWLLVYINRADAEPKGLALISVLTVFLLVVFYLRLRQENIIEIQLIDNMLDDINKLIPSIIQNEWFKGISIAALGGVVSGLVLNKISKKK